MPTTNLDAMRQKIRQYAQEADHVQTLPAGLNEEVNEQSKPVKPPAFQSYHVPLAKEKVDHFQENQLTIPIGRPSPAEPIPLNQHQVQAAEMPASPPTRTEVALPPAVNPEPLPTALIPAQSQPIRPNLEQTTQPQSAPETVAAPEDTPEQHGLLFNPENSPAQPANLYATPEPPLAAPAQEQPNIMAVEAAPAPVPQENISSDAEPAGSSGPNDAALANLIQFRRQKMRQNLTHAA